MLDTTGAGQAGKDAFSRILALAHRQYESWFWYIAVVSGYAVLHAGAVTLGYLLKTGPQEVSIFWPASGLLVAALLLFPYRYWLALMGGFILGAQIPDMAFCAESCNYLTMAVYRVAHGIEALLGAFLIRRFVADRISFFRLNNVVGFILLMAFVAIPIGATIGLFAQQIAFANADLWVTWEVWWVADFIGALIVCPFVVVAARAPWRHFSSAGGQEIAELGLVSLLVIVLTYKVFTTGPVQVFLLLELPYFLYPLLVWMAVRFHGSLAISALLFTAIVAIWFTCHGSGPFYIADNPSPLRQIELTLFLVLTAFFVLFLTATMSERRRAQRQISDQKQQLSMLMSNLPGMVYRSVNSPEPIMKFVSAGCKALTGYDAEFLLDNTKGYSTLIHPDDKEFVRQGVERALQENRPYHLTYRIQTANKQEKWVLEQGQGIFYGKAKRLSIEGVIIDITERKVAEQALIESEERYRRFIETSVEGIWRMEYRQPIAISLPVDAQVQLIYQHAHHDEVNQVYLQQYRFPSAIHARQVTLNELIPKSDERNWKMLREFVRDEYRLTSKTLYGVDRDGNNRTFLVNLVGTIENGFLVRSWGMQIDITEQKDIEEEQLKLQLQVQQLQKHEALGVLASGIAHDFNNILTGSLGFVELALAKTEPDSRIYYYLEQIRQSGERARDLVSQILAFSRPDPGKRSLVEITDILDEAVGFLEASLPDSIRIVVSSSRKDSSILADSSQVYQVIVNLCTNAAQSMPDGGVLTLALENVELSENLNAVTGRLMPGSYMRLRVSDTGVGMSSEIISKIFDPFFTTKTSGSGLGLSVVLSVVQSHGGVIDVSSRSGAGSNVEVYFPHCREVLSDSGIKVNRSKAQLKKGSGQQILVVDDDLLVGRITQEMLMELNYQADVYTSSVAALAEFTENPTRYELVLSDWTMPELNGLTLCKEIKQISPTLPIVLMTGETNDAALRAESGLIEGVLIKPLSLAELATMLASVFELKSPG